MKGKLINKQEQWVIQYLEAQDAKYMSSQMTDVKELPLHPDDYAIASLLSIKNGVEFDKVDTLGQVYYAKLIQPKSERQKLVDKFTEIVIKQSKEETWDDIFAKIASESDVSDAVTPGGAFFRIKKYLSQNYFSPKKK